MKVTRKCSTQVLPRAELASLSPDQNYPHKLRRLRRSTGPRHHFPRPLPEMTTTCAVDEEQPLLKTSATPPAPRSDRSHRTRRGAAVVVAGLLAGGVIIAFRALHPFGGLTHAASFDAFDSFTGRQVAGITVAEPVTRGAGDYNNPQLLDTGRACGLGPSNLPAFFPCLLVSYRPLAYNPGAGFHRAKVTGASRHNPEAHPQPSDTGRLTAGPARTRNINI